MVESRNPLDVDSAFTDLLADKVETDINVACPLSGVAILVSAILMDGSLSSKAVIGQVTLTERA